MWIFHIFIFVKNILNVRNFVNYEEQTLLFGLK